MKSNADYEHLFCPVEYKFVDTDAGIVEGYASIFGNEDVNREVVEPGAFRKTIAEQVKRGIVPFLDSHRWDIAHTLGSITDATEDSKGLQYRAKLSAAPSVQDARIKMREGHIHLNSIGYRTMRDSYQRNPDTKAVRRHLHELRMFEISALPVAANDQAAIISVKSVAPFEDLPLAPRDFSWEPATALKRVSDWAGGEKINWTKFRRAFVGCDPARPDDAAAYKMPIADVSNGELVAVPQAIFAAAKSATDDEGARAHLDRYFEKMASEFHDDSIAAPWEGKAADEPYGDVPYADPGYQSDKKKRYPVDTKEHAKAAWSYINMPKNAAKYSPEHLASVKAKIEAACKKFGVDVSKKSVDALILEARELGVYDVSQIREAAIDLLGILEPADYKQLLDEFSAGPPVLSTTAHRGSELDAGTAQVLRRSVLLKSEIVRRRIQ